MRAPRRVSKIYERRGGVFMYRGTNEAAKLISRLAAEEITLEELHRLNPKVWGELRSGSVQHLALFNVYRILNSNGWTIAELNRQTDVGRNIIYFLGKANSILSMRSFDKVRKGLNVSIRDLFISPFSDEVPQHNAKSRANLVKTILDQETVHLEKAILKARLEMNAALDKAEARFIAAIREARNLE